MILPAAMRGVGGPLLCIGDLLSDVGEGDSLAPSSGPHSPPLNAQSPNSNSLGASCLSVLFQENYDELDKALSSSTDKSWTSLTLKLCSALEAGNKLVEYGNMQVSQLSEKVEQLERITKQIDSAVTAAKPIQGPFGQFSVDSKHQ